LRDSSIQGLHGAKIYPSRVSPVQKYFHSGSPRCKDISIQGLPGAKIFPFRVSPAQIFPFRVSPAFFVFLVLYNFCPAPLTKLVGEFPCTHHIAWVAWQLITMLIGTCLSQELCAISQTSLMLHYKQIGIQSPESNMQIHPYGLLPTPLPMHLFPPAPAASAGNRSMG